MTLIQNEPEICVMKTPTTTATISFLRDIFSRFGVPETLVTDNGTQFTSFEFADFRRVNGIQHIGTPPYHPQSNDQVERFVDTLKRAIFKAQGEGNNEEILNAFLKTYRCTPHKILDNESLAEVMFGKENTNFMRPDQAMQKKHSTYITHPSAANTNI